MLDGCAASAQQRSACALSDHRGCAGVDIDGGMSVDIYDSMATGVQSAACIIPFMTEKYGASQNCALELKFAREMGVPIVPVLMQSKRADGSPWKAGGWLYVRSIR